MDLRDKNKNGFFNDFNTSGGFSKSFLTDKKTVCIQHKDGRITEHKNITDPWKYITKVKREMDIISAWIKEE